VSSFDSRIQTWARYLQSSTNQDRALKLLQWTLWLVSYILKKRQEQRSGNRLAGGSGATNDSSSTSRHIQGLRKLYLDVAFARYATRLLGLVGAVEAVRTDSWAASSDKYPNLMKWIGRVLAWSMIGYYPTEHIAYAKWMAPAAYVSKQGDRSAERWSYLSCRFWLVYILAESAQCLIQMKELQDKLDGDDG